MSAHRRHRRERRSSGGRTRVLVGLAVVAVVCAGLSLRGTFAFWTGSASVNAGSFKTGTLDLTLDGKALGEGGSTTEASLQMTAMLPGDSVAANVDVKNAGDVGFTYVTSGSTSNALANGLQVWVTTGVAGGSGRSGTCGGSSGTDSSFTTLTGTNAPFGVSRTLAPGATDTLCVVARLSPTAPSSMQGATGTATLIFDAKQAGA